MNAPPVSTELSAAPRRTEPDFTSRTDTLPENPSRLKSPWLWICIASLVVAAAVDVPLAIPAFNRVLREQPALSVLCAVGFAIITLLAAFTTGREVKRGNVWAAVGGVVAVAALIGGLFVLRRLAADEAAGSALVGLEGASAPAASNEEVIAFVMAFFVLASALIAAIEGYLLTDTPRGAALRKVVHAISHHENKVQTYEAQEVRHREDLASKANDLARVDLDLDAARQGLDAFALELQELARTEYAAHLGDPSATSNLDLPLPPR